MADNNSLTGTLINFFLIGLFLLSMTAGYISLVNSEGRGEIFDGYEAFENLNLGLKQNLTGIQGIGNINANLSSKYNPELAISAADQTGNAMGINIWDLVVGSFNSISIFFGLIFGNVWTGTLSILLSGLLITLLGMYLVKFIRRGD